MGTVSSSLELPDGYQHWDWDWRAGTKVNGADDMRIDMSNCDTDLYLYTQHEVFYEQGDVIRQTRSAPNWDGGVVTMATCKHHMRTTDRRWEGTWIAALGPKHCAENTLLFVGMVYKEFESNYELGQWLKRTYRAAYDAKLATCNPRGDIYTPKKELLPKQRFDHKNFVTPEGHTRSTEFYKKSPGSTSDRPDGKVPKWWRDVEYVGRGQRRPPVFVLRPVYLFSQPTLWTTYKPGRACLRLTPGQLAASLRGSPP
jgi:hypothetical protein